MGHYVFADTFSADIQQRLIKQGQAGGEFAVTTQMLDKTISLKTFPLSSQPCFVVSACSAETEKVSKLSSEENLQPFKDKMEEFLSQGELFSKSHDDLWGFHQTHVSTY